MNRSIQAIFLGALSSQSHAIFLCLVMHQPQISVFGSPFAGAVFFSDFFEKEDQRMVMISRSMTSFPQFSWRAVWTWRLADRRHWVAHLALKEKGKRQSSI